MDYAKESLRLHGEWKGKIEVIATAVQEIVSGIEHRGRSLVGGRGCIIVLHTDRGMADLPADIVHQVFLRLPFQEDIHIDTDKGIHESVQPSGDRKSTRLNSSHPTTSRMPSSA